MCKNLELYCPYQTHLPHNTTTQVENHISTSLLTLPICCYVEYHHWRFEPHQFANQGKPEIARLHDGDSRISTIRNEISKLMEKSHVQIVGGVYSEQHFPWPKSSMRRHFSQLLSSRIANRWPSKWHPKPLIRVGRLTRDEIIRRSEAQVTNLFAAGEAADVVEEVVRARRGIWGGLSGGKQLTLWSSYCEKTTR